MQTHYLADSVSVDTTGMKFKPDFDIKKFAFYTEDGNYAVRMRCKETWGPWVSGFPYIEISDEMPCREIEVRALTSSIQLHYYIRGER